MNSRSRFIFAAWMVLVFAMPALAQDSQPASHEPPIAGPIDPYDAVRQGNRLLKDGQPAEALEHYERAEQVKPDAREIAFVEGLAQYHLGDYERARELFRKAATGGNDALADDATYSLGTTYHGDALLSMDDPKAALGDLEQAMAYYQSVLGNNPDHAAARDAYRKAGAVWRQVKQQMQQQPQQNPSDKQNDEDQEQDEQNQDRQQPQDQSHEQQDQQQAQESDRQEEQDQQRSSDSKQDQEQQASSPQGEQESEEPPPSMEQQQEEVSREQAERKLREMMQALRERKERRRHPARLMPVRPVEKDW